MIKSSLNHFFDPNSELLKFDGNSTRSKFDLLHAVRYKVEHREISRSSSGEKRRLCSILGDHLRCGDADLILYSAQVRRELILWKKWIIIVLLKKLN